MNSVRYQDLVFSVQALRRQAERELHLGGALGIAGKLWPHQIANVARVLRDTSVRHLLADEVGLGKTVQAIMVIKALRLQRPALRIGILVPDKLQRQWAEEMLARANMAVIEGEPPDGVDHRPVLLWPSAKGIDDVPLESFDLLVVDELPRMNKELQERVLRASTRVTHLLVLTATPLLGEPQQARLIMGLIEPTRAALAGEDPVAWLREREQAVAELLDEWPQRALAGPPPEPAGEVAALAYAATRRLLRTRRSVWRDYLPTRRARIRLVEPTQTERRRQELLWQWIRSQGASGSGLDLVALAQRVRSPASLRQRVSELREDVGARDEILGELAETFESGPGDSRMEGLLDTLLEIWEAAPREKVLIAANDNTTVDELAKQLMRAFDAMPPTGAPLRIARIRNQTAGPGALVDRSDQIAAAASAFRTGEAQVLLLAEAGAAGLNLQCARHIVLYSVPWDPTEVEQLIGRVDRLGNPSAAKDDGSGRALPIEVHVIAQHGLVDHRVLRVIEATQLLEESISVDGEDVERVRQHIEAAALSDSGKRWSPLMTEAQGLSRPQEVQLPLHDLLPTAPDRAYGLATALVSTPPLEPAMKSQRAGDAGWSEALLEWLKGLHAAHLYRLTLVDREARISRLGYQLPAARVSSVMQLPTRPLGALPELKSRVFFRVHRRHLEDPPMMRWGEDGAPLHFFSHGSEPHEDLVKAWTEQPLNNARFALSCPPPHPVAKLAGSVIRVRVALLDAARLLPDGQRSQAELESDQRFVRGVLSTAVLYSGALLRRGTASSMPDEELRALLAPDSTSPLLSTRTGAWRAPVWLTADREKQAEEIAVSLQRERARALWSPRRPALEAAVAGRRYVLAADALDASELAARRRARLEAQIDAAEATNSLLAARFARQLETHLGEEHEREQQEAARDKQFEGLLDRSPEDAIQPFADAWILIEA